MPQEYVTSWTRGPVVRVSLFEHRSVIIEVDNALGILDAGFHSQSHMRPAFQWASVEEHVLVFFSSWHSSFSFSTFNSIATIATDLAGRVILSPRQTGQVIS